MATEIKPIRNDADHAAAMAEIERLWGAAPDSSEGDRLDVLATLVDAYETQRFPINLLDPIAAVQFRMEQQGLSAEDRAMTSPRKRTLPLPMILQLVEADEALMSQTILTGYEEGLGASDVLIRGYINAAF